MASTNIARLNRVIGQLSGIVKMIEKGDSCDKIAIQFQAVQGALGNCFSNFLQENLEKCLVSKNKKQMEGLLKLLVRK